MKKEKDVKEAIKKILKARGIWFTMPYQAGFSQAGVPDFICCFKGHFLAIEAKFGDNKPTFAQRLRMAEIVEAGGTALVINEKNVGDLAGMLDDIANGDP